MESFWVAVNAVVPFLFYICFGYFVRRLGLVDIKFLNKMNQMVFRAFFPILMFMNLYQIKPGFALNPKIVVFAVSCLFSVIIFAWLIVPLLVKENPRRGVIIQALYRSNFAFFLIGIHLPACVEKPMKQFSDMTTPLALFVLGGTLRFSAIQGNLKYLVPTLLTKMLLIPAMILMMALKLGFTSVERFIVFAMFATPVATASYTMAQNMGGDGELAGEFVVISTAASVVSIFLWVFFMKQFGII